MDAGDVERFRWRPDPDRPRAANAAAAAERAGQVAARVAAVPRERLALVLGGDCTTGVGTVAGLIAPRRRAGLVYLDRHADLNVPSSTIEGALDWMGVAHLLDVEGATPRARRARRRARRCSPPSRLAFLALAPVTPFEPAEIERRAARTWSGSSGDRATRRAPRAAALAALDAGVLAVHFDVDVLDFRDAPLAENTDREPGLPLASAAEGAARRCCADPRVAALTVTEFNPHHGAADGADTRRLIEVLAAAL